MTNEFITKEIAVYRGWRIREQRKTAKSKPIYYAYFQEYANQMPLMLNAPTIEELKEMVDKKHVKRKVFCKW